MILVFQLWDLRPNSMQNRYTTSHQKQICCPSTWLFDKLSDNNPSDNGLFLAMRSLQNNNTAHSSSLFEFFALLAALLLVILTLGNDAILVAYKLMPVNTYARDGSFRYNNPAYQ